MTLLNRNFIAGVALCALPGLAFAQAKKPQAGPPEISRASLANSATFTVSQTLTPTTGTKTVRTYRVEVKGNQARLDYDDASLGTVRYLANAKGVFFYIPGNKSAVKQSLKGGVEGALKLAFAQVSAQMQDAKRIGTANVSGQPTVVYKAPQTGATIYWGTRPGYRLPVKTEIKNEGGTSTILVSNIKLNVPLTDARFAVPAGTQMVESQGAPSVPGM